LLLAEQKQSPRQFLTVADVARLYCITERSVYSLIERGLLQPVRIEGLRRVLFRVEDVARLIK
jgi:excisionase family DNA binding protein